MTWATASSMLYIIAKLSIVSHFYQWSSLYIFGKEKFILNPHTKTLSSQCRDNSKLNWNIILCVCKNFDLDDVFLFITDKDKTQSLFCSNVRKYPEQNNMHITM